MFVVFVHGFLNLVSCLSFDLRRLSFVVCLSSCVVRCFVSVDCGLLFVAFVCLVCRLLFVVCSLLFVVFFVLVACPCLFVVCCVCSCLSFVVRCLSFVVRRSLLLVVARCFVV